MSGSGKVGPYGHRILTKDEVDDIYGRKPDLFMDISLEPKATAHAAPQESRDMLAGQYGSSLAQFFALSTRASPRSLPHPPSHYSQDILGKIVPPEVEPTIILGLIKSELYLRACCDVKSDDASRKDTMIMPRFTKKCTVCGEEYDSPVERCDAKKDGMECGGAVADPDQEQRRTIQKIMKDPNPDLTWKDIRRRAAWFLEGIDNSWIEARFNEQTKLPEFWPASPETMRYAKPGFKKKICPVCAGEKSEPVIDNYGVKKQVCPSHPNKELELVKYIELKETNTSEIHAYFTDSQMIHYARHKSRYYGDPPIWSARHELRAKIEAILYNADVFEGREVPNKVVGIEGASDQEILRIDEEWKEETRANQHYTHVTNKKVSGVDLFPSNKEMQYQQMYNTFRNGILAIMKVPMIKLGISETGGAGMVVGWQLIGSYWDSVEDGMEQFDEAMTAFLKRHYGITDWYLQTESSRPFDDEKIHADQRNDVQAGIISINEIRVMRGLDPIQSEDGESDPLFDRPQPPAAHTGGLPPNNQGQEFGPMPPGPSTYLLETRMQPRRTPPGKSITGAAVVEARFLEELKREYRARVSAAAAKGERLDRAELEALFDRTVDELVADFEQMARESTAEAYEMGVRQGARDLEISFEITDTDRQAIAYIAEKPKGVIESLKTFGDDQRKAFSDIIAEEYTSPDGFSYQRLVNRMKATVDAEAYKLERIARSETTLISNIARDRAYELFEIERGETQRYVWVGPDDARTSDICSWIKAEIRRRGKGKGVEREVLREIQLEAISRFGTGGVYLRPHPNCRHTQARKVS